MYYKTFMEQKLMRMSEKFTMNVHTVKYNLRSFDLGIPPYHIPCTSSKVITKVIILTKS